MKKIAIAMESFLQGFTQEGLFGWAKMPGAADVFYDETTGLEDAHFRDLFAPYLTRISNGPAASPVGPSSTTDPTDGKPDE